MMNSFLSACEVLVGLAAGKGRVRVSSISRLSMPNGFFLHDLLWFGDGGARRETLELRRRDPLHGQFGVLVRAERYERYRAAMEEGRLRRERLTIFFSRTVETKAPVAGQSVVAEYFDTLARKESLSLLEFGLGVLCRLFPDCRISPMTDRDHFLHYYRFLNTNIQMTEIDPLELFDPGSSIQQNCVHGDGIAWSSLPGVSFVLDCYYHAIFVVRQWPRRTFP